MGLWLIFLEVEILATERSPAGTQEEPLNKLRENPVGHLVQRVPNTGTAKGTWWVIVVDICQRYGMRLWNRGLKPAVTVRCTGQLTE